MSSLEKAFRVVDIGPDAENKNEVFQFFIFIIFKEGNGDRANYIF